MPTISIITAIHNGIAINKLFVEYLKKYTYYDYELIIINNASTDGSDVFFEKEGAIVLTNTQNFSYPVCQNQGIAKASGKYLFFLNNDLVVSPNWDKHLIDIAALHQLDVLSAAGIENMGSKKKNQQISRKWKRIKNPLLLFGLRLPNLRLMHKLMYGHWEKYCAQLFEQHQQAVIEGIVGDNVMMTRKALELIGPWDERLQTADFDIFMRAKKRYLTVGDMKPVHVALGVYIHHFGKMTLKYASRKPIPFADKDNLISLADKWTAEELQTLHL